MYASTRPVVQLRDKLLSAAPLSGLSGDIESVVVCAGKRGMINNDITDVVIAQFVYIGVDIFHVTTRYKCRLLLLLLLQ